MTITIKSTSKEALLEAGVPRAKIKLVDREHWYEYVSEFEVGCAKEVVEILKRGRK